jgi:hypothetical protein
MGALIMSLLFLSNILDPFQALDDAGRPIPHAVLTFWHSQTSAPATVYADQELLIELSDAQGRVFADAQGIFPLIYLDPDTLYRVRLQTGEGVLRWDVDPYLCDCTDPPRLFRNPLHQALTRIEGLIPRFEPPPVPGAQLIFTDYNTGAPARVWADAARTVPLRNPLPSNAAGIFPPVYLEDGIEYRVRLVAPDGSMLLDANPYECYCGFLLLTSRPYALGVIEALDSSIADVREGPNFGAMDALLSTSLPIEIDLRAPIVEYEMPPDALDSAASIMSGTLRSPLITYSAGAEALDSIASIQSGTLRVALVRYTNYQAEALDSSCNIIGGTLA